MPTTKELAELLLESAPEHEGWSVVESPNSAGCYEELLRWASECSIQAWMSDAHIRRPQLGLVLLWLESEVARRHGGEGTLWPILANQDIVPWNAWVHGELFQGAGHATQKHRDLLRGAAHHYSLRHTFEEEEGMNWYRLIYLQFGFTHDDAVQRLAPWLSGQILPVSVQRLLEAGDSGAQAFQAVWRSLRMFRLGNLNKATLDGRLKSNPWVLPEWRNDLVKAAERSSAQVLEVADLETAELKFFTAPRLIVPEQGQPYFVTSLCNLDELALEAPGYELKVGDQVLARLFRQDDGSYSSDAPESIVLPTKPTMAISLVGDNSRIAEHDEAVLWDPMEEVAVYSQRTGAQIQPGVRLRAGTGVYLIAAEDVSLKPSSEESINLGLGYGLHRIAPGWSGQLEALLDGEVIWTSNSAPATESVGPAGVSARFTATLDLRAGGGVTSKAPWALPILVRIPQGWNFKRLRWRRGDGQRVELSEIPSHLTLTETDAVRPVVLRVRISNGSRSQTDVLRVPVPFVAALKWNKERKPFHHIPGRKLMLGEAQQFTWSFSLPAENGEPRDPRTCSFAEGNLLHGRLKARPATLPDLSGYGAPLHVVSDPYWPNSSIMEVAPCVLDGGVIGSVVWNPQEGGFHIKSTFTEIGDDHQLSVWLSSTDGDARIEHLPHAELLPRDDGWFWPVSQPGQLHAVALTFRGARLGSWFDFRWSNCLSEKLPGSIPETAAMLRAWKAPFLQEEGGNFERIVAWFEEHWLKILPIWITQAKVTGPDGVPWPMPRATVGWMAVVSEFLLACLPSPDDESTEELVRVVAPGMGGANAIGSAVWKMADVCPILAARVARIYLNEFVKTAERNLFFQQFLAIPELATTDARAEEVARMHGNRDGFWLETTVPTLQTIEQTGLKALPYAYRFLSKSMDYRLFALGRWLREIR
jgi:hypothetical protein